MSQAEIGLIGLGVMGSNLALNIAENGHSVAVYNRNPDRTDQFFASAGALQSKIVPCRTREELVAAIRPPRPVIIMIKAGDPVDQQIAALRELMDADDIIIDAGNANFRDTVRRMKGLDGSGLSFIGMGVSGGEEGARHGPSIMVGGPRAAYERVEDVLLAISAKYEGEPCCAWLGPDGAGHFVKTIHNGIEYGDMQMIAEIYGILRDGFGMTPGEMSKVFAEWNKGPLNSYLIEITAKVLAVTDPKTDKPIVDIILDQAGQKGTGRWAVIEAQTMGIPATAIEAAVAARVLSALKPQREAAERVYGEIPLAFAVDDRGAALKKLELALLAGKIAAYAQGFAVMRGASDEFGWDLPMATIARIWRAGCIIRSQFLDTIASAFETDRDIANLLVASRFVEMMKNAQAPLRDIVSLSVTAGLPTPALSSAVAYFDGYRQSRGTANLIQAQRDFFGAHGFERIDAEGEHHGPWGDQ